MKAKDGFLWKYKNLDEDFQQSKSSAAANSVYKARHQSLRLMKWMPFFDKD